MALVKYSTKSSAVERHTDTLWTGTERRVGGFGEEKGSQRWMLQESRERAGGQGGCRDPREQFWGVHVCASMCMCVHVCASRRNTVGEHGDMRREDNRVLETKLTFGSCNTGENLMRTKICLPNSPKKSLKHFVIPKCLENELVALQEPLYTSPAVCSSPCRRMLRAWHSRHPPLRVWGKEGAAGRGIPAPHPALAQPLPTQASELLRASVSPSQDFKRCPKPGVKSGTAQKQGESSPGSARSCSVSRHSVTSVNLPSNRHLGIAAVLLQGLSKCIPFLMSRCIWLRG